MAVEIEQGKAFAARRQRFVAIKPRMVNIHDALAAPVWFIEPVPSPPLLEPVSSRSFLDPLARPNRCFVIRAVEITSVAATVQPIRRQL